MEIFTNLFQGLLTIAGIILLFLLTREIWTWFFKLNLMVKQNDEIIRLLKKLNNEPVEPQKNSDKNKK